MAVKVTILLDPVLHNDLISLEDGHRLHTVFCVVDNDQVISDGCYKVSPLKDMVKDLSAKKLNTMIGKMMMAGALLYEGSFEEFAA